VFTTIANNICFHVKVLGNFQGQTVCAASAVTWSRQECTGPCQYLPPAADSDAFTETDLQCAVIRTDIQRDTMQMKAANATLFDCDCPCSDMVQPESPPVAVLCLSYFSQSFIGANLREEGGGGGGGGVKQMVFVYIRFLYFHDHFDSVCIVGINLGFKDENLKVCSGGLGFYTAPTSSIRSQCLQS
jgi:hypothetical protein